MGYEALIMMEQPIPVHFQFPLWDTNYQIHILTYFPVLLSIPFMGYKCSRD